MDCRVATGGFYWLLVPRVEFELDHLERFQVARFQVARFQVACIQVACWVATTLRIC